MFRWTWFCIEELNCIARTLPTEPWFQLMPTLTGEMNPNLAELSPAGFWKGGSFLKTGCTLSFFPLNSFLLNFLVSFGGLLSIAWVKRILIWCLLKQDIWRRNAPPGLKLRTVAVAVAHTSSCVLSLSEKSNIFMARFDKIIHLDCKDGMWLETALHVELRPWLSQGEDQFQLNKEISSSKHF